MCKPYSPRVQAVRHTIVGYRHIAIKVVLSSRDKWIYTDSLQQKQAILRLFGLYPAVLLMIDNLFLVV